MSILLSVFLLASCNNEDIEMTNADTLVNHSVTVEKAKQNVVKFMSQMNLSSRSSMNDVRISDVQVVSVPTTVKSRSGLNYTNDTLFYVINFADSCGYVIASSDDREPEVWALVEAGNYRYEFTDTIRSGFDLFMNNLVDQAADFRQDGVQNQFISDRNIIDVEDEPGGGAVIRPDKFEVMSPLLNTKWDQRTYNKYCSNGLTGCVPTAVAQIFSFLSAPSQVRYLYNNEYGSTILDWERINQECSVGDGNVISDDLKEEIAILMRYLGVAFDAEYGRDATSVSTKDAINLIRDYIGINASSLSDYDVDKVIRDLRTGNKILLMRGNASCNTNFLGIKTYDSGHAWVVDGFIDKIERNVETKYIHCNWGWGSDGNNGYFVSNVLDAAAYPEYNDAIGSRSYYYRYKLETSTFTK